MLHVSEYGLMKYKNMFYMKIFWKNRFDIHMMLRYIKPHNIGRGTGEVRKPWFLRVNATTLTDIDVLSIERGPRKNTESILCPLLCTYNFLSTKKMDSCLKCFQIF